MTACGERPQELICAAAEGAVPILEAWFIGGRGSRQEPLQVEVLGTLDDRSAGQAFAALQQLMGRHGPWMVLDCYGVGSIDATGMAFLHALSDLARTRDGTLAVHAPAELLAWRVAAGGRQPPAPRRSGGLDAQAVRSGSTPGSRQSPPRRLRVVR